MFKLSEDRDFKHKLNQPLVKVGVIITVESKVHVADMRTKIRALEGFVIVNSKEKIERPEHGAEFSFIVSVKYLPDGSDVYKMLEEMGKLLKIIPGLKTVRFVSAGERKIVKDGKPIVFWQLIKLDIICILIYDFGTAKLIVKVKI